MYEEEILDDETDDGTMPASREALEQAVVGHKIVSVSADTITLDDGRKVTLIGEGDCCAYTELEAFLLHPDLVDHVIMGVGTTGKYSTWHIYCDLGDILELTVGWSGGNVGYYGYGFTIHVED